MCDFCEEKCVELQMMQKRCEAYRHACAYKEEQVKILEAQVAQMNAALRVQERTEQKLFKILNNGYIKNLMDQLGFIVPERSAKVFLMNQ